MSRESELLQRPTTRAGHRAAWFALAAVAVFGAAILRSVSFDAPGSDDTDGGIDIAGSLFFLALAATGVAALVFSARGLKQGDRSVLVWLALVVGLFFTAVVVGEVTVFE